MTVYDYARSFVTFVTRGRENNARLQVESVCSLHDQASGSTTEYFFFASCKSESVFVDRGLFSEDNYDFCGIFADEEFAVFRTRSAHTDGFREEGLWRDRFEDEPGDRIGIHIAGDDRRFFGIFRILRDLIQFVRDFGPCVGWIGADFELQGNRALRVRALTFEFA